TFFFLNAILFISPYRFIFHSFFFFFFFFNDTATTEIYTLSLHDALPIWLHLRLRHGRHARRGRPRAQGAQRQDQDRHRDRKSTRLNSSHRCISYAVFCLKKKKKKKRKNNNQKKKKKITQQ